MLGFVVILSSSKATEPAFHFVTLRDSGNGFPRTEADPWVAGVSSYCGVGRGHGFTTPTFGLQTLLSGLVALSRNVRRMLNRIDPLLELHGLFHQTRSSRSPDLCGLRGAPEPCG